MIWLHVSNCLANSYNDTGAFNAESTIVCDMASWNQEIGEIQSDSSHFDFYFVHP